MEKIKELWAALVAKVGLDWAIAIAGILAVALVIDPAIAAIVGVLFVLYKMGKLTKPVAKLKKLLGLAE